MADIVTSRVFVDGEKGITAAKLNDITASSVIQPAFYTSKPTAGTADPTDIALILKSGAYAQVPVSTLGGSATQAQIWSTRLRSFNAIGNPNFEVDQRTAGAGSTAGAGLFAIDRWFFNRAAGTTIGASGAQFAPSSPDIALPGTNFRISRCCFRVTLTTQQVSLAASDFLQLNQAIEGPNWRELSTDVHSVSLLARSSVANLSFGLTLADPPTPTKSLTKLCALGAANTWTLIQLPNLPVWPSGNFLATPSSPGYQIRIVLASGSSVTAPANDTWQTGNFWGAVGQSNFAASPVNSTFDIAFVQHEPGPVCSTFIDKPFSQSLDECLRYYCKSYDYATRPGTATSNGRMPFIVPSIAGLNIAAGANSFPKPMARVPSVINTWAIDGTANSCTDNTNGGNKTTTVTIFSERSFTQFTLGTASTSGALITCQYIADTGW